MRDPPFLVSFFGHRYLIQCCRPLVSFCASFAPLCPPLARLWLPLAPFWFPLAPFWLFLGSLRLPFGGLWLNCGALWLLFSTLWVQFWNFLSRFSTFRTLGLDFHIFCLNFLIHRIFPVAFYKNYVKSIGNKMVSQFNVFLTICFFSCHVFSHPISKKTRKRPTATPSHSSFRSHRDLPWTRSGNLPQAT